MSHEDFGNLQDDLRLTGASLGRRQLLRLAIGAGALHLLGCGGNNGGSTGSDDTTLDACTQIPEETAGPYPGDGSNGPDVLDQTGVVRSDITSSFAGLTGTAAGIPLTVTLTIVNASDCTPLAGRAVYLWHCDQQGRYSLYSSGVTDQNYLRGVQETDASGQVTFQSIFPGCYSGRWPHIHFEVYPSLAAATSVGNKIATSQLAFPKAACDQVYGTSGYEQSVTNLAGISLASDNIFGNDGGVHQLASMSGSVAAGYTALLTVPV